MVSLKGRTGETVEGGKIDSQIDEERQIYYGKTRERRRTKRERAKRGRDSDDGGGSFREITGFTGTRLSGRECGCAQRARVGKRGMQLDVCTVCGGGRSGWGRRGTGERLCCMRAGRASAMAQVAGTRGATERGRQEQGGRERGRDITRTGHAGQRVAR